MECTELLESLMNKRNWTICKKIVISLFFLFYSCFVITEALPKQWLIGRIALKSVPAFMKALGLEYRLILFAGQTKYVNHYDFFVHFPNGLVSYWSYPDKDFAFDRHLYERVFMNYMSDGDAPELHADLARYLARKFDSLNNHPYYVNCQKSVRTIPPLESKFVDPIFVRPVFSYAVKPEDLQSDLSVSKYVASPLDK